MTDSQSASLPWYEATMWDQPPILFVLHGNYLQTVGCLFLWAASLMKGRGCDLHLLLGLASAVVLGSESLGTHNNKLLAQFLNTPN
jgi:hypothetical protein